MTEPRKLSEAQLRAEIAPLVPDGINADQVVAGVILSLIPPAERTLPMVQNPFQRDVLYAWSEEDVSATKFALELLSQLGQALLAGPAGLINLGLAVKEVVCFLVDLKRHSVRVTDPLQIKVLMMLRDADAGLSAQQLRARFGAAEAPTLAEIETALESLARADAHGRPEPLVRADGLTWRILV